MSVKYFILCLLAAIFFGGIAWLLGGQYWGLAVGGVIMTLFYLTPEPGDYP